MANPKYKLGDQVWHASTHTEQKQHPCPDCLGKKEWKAISPAGTEYSFSCPRCAGSYQSRRSSSLNYTQFSPNARLLTIGQVGFTESAEETEIRYMCIETGVGSGSLYDEKDLFTTKEEAMIVAGLRAQESNSTVKWIVEQYSDTLKLSDYELKNAEVEGLKNDLQAQILKNAWVIRDFIDSIECCVDMSEVMAKIEAFNKEH